MYATLIATYAHAETAETQRIHDTLKCMKERGLSVDSITYSFLIRAYMSDTINHPEHLEIDFEYPKTDSVSADALCEHQPGSFAQPAHLAGDSGPLPSPFSHSARVHTKRLSHGQALQGIFVLALPPCLLWGFACW